MSRILPVDRTGGQSLRSAVAGCLLFGVGLLAWLVLPAGASAASIEGLRIREVFPGSTARPEQEWVELQAETVGQNELAGHQLTFYDNQGFEVHEIPLQNVASGESQDTILVASSNSGLNADIEFAPNLDFSGTGGAVCLEAIDCVSWGTATQLIPSTPSPIGAPAARVPDGSALIRSITRGCATLLDPADDTDDSATDFVSGTPDPRTNAMPPNETPCGTRGGETPPGGSGSGGSTEPGNTTPAPMNPNISPPPDTTPPQTRIVKLSRRGPDGRSATVHFGGTDNLPGQLTFRCKIDHKPFRRCTSGKTYHELSVGPHLIEVAAVDGVGNVDQTPAKAHFSVTEASRSSRGS